MTRHVHVIRHVCVCVCVCVCSLLLQWTDDSTLVLTVVQGPCTIIFGGAPEGTPGICPESTLPYALGTLQIQPQAQIKNGAATSDPASDLVDFNEYDPLVWGNPGAPVFLSALVSDYDNFNTDWSGQDIIKLNFDRATDQGNLRASGGRQYVDRLFGFDHWLGDDYSGAWTDASTFAITALTTTILRPATGRSTVTSSRVILNTGATARGVRRTAAITGDFGAADSAPRPISFVALDPMVASDGAAPGDKVHVTFNMATDGGGGRPVDELFTFTPPLPTDTSRRWISSSIFEILIGPSGHGPDGTALLVGATQVSVRPGTIRSSAVAIASLGQPSAAGTYASEINLTLTGSFGSAEPPRIASLIASDPMNADEVFGDGDALVFDFDMYTTESGVLATKASVDAILGFSSSLGTDYTGAWSNCFGPTPGFCKTLTITIVISSMGEADHPPVIGRTLAWVKAPDADNLAQPPNWGGIRSASELSTYSTSVITLGTSSVTSDAEPMHPVLDLGRDRIIFVQRTREPVGVTPLPPEVIAARTAVFSAAATAAAAAAEGIPNSGVLSERYQPMPYGASHGLFVRQCSLLVAAEPQQRRLAGGLTIRRGSCNMSDAMPPISVTAGHLRAGGCGDGGFGCGLHVELSAIRPALVRPPGAPLEGNTSINILGHHLASVRLCEFRVPGLPYGGAITRAIGYDAAGFRCPVPAVNTSLFVGYDRGSVSQRVTLRLSEDGDTFFDSGVEFVYFRQPVLMGAHPLYGPLTGGSTVIYGMGLHAVLADPSAARCKLGGLITPVRAIAPNGEHLTCDLPPLPDGFVLGAGYSLAVAINGVTFIDDARVRTFSYYTPPANASLQPVSGATEAQTEVTVYAAGLLVDTEKTEPRCRFGSAGTSAAEIVTVASTDPLRPELSHIELRCRAPLCMQAACVGTVEVTIAMNGYDYTGFAPPLLFRYTSEFVMHVWGCDEARGGSGAAGGASGDACGEAVVQRATSLANDQHSLAVERERLASSLNETIRPARREADANLAARENDRASTSWELVQARRDASLARAREAEVTLEWNQTMTALDHWDGVATVARVPLTGRSHFAVDSLDKRVYWAERGAIYRAHYAPGGAVGAHERLVDTGASLSGLFLHRPSAKLFWTAQGESGGYEVHRSYLDGGRDEVLFADMPAQTRVHAAYASTNGLLRSVYVGVAQPANASLLLLIEAKERATDERPANTTVVTLLRGVAPTALVQHGAYFYYSVGVTQAIYRCDLDGRNCVTLHSVGSANTTLPWIMPPARRATPAGVALDSTSVHGLLWADQAADRIFRSSANGSGSEALWWPAYHPIGVEMSFDGASAMLPPRLHPTILGVKPLGGPISGNSSITVIGTALGRVRELRYVREEVWPAPASAGLGLAFLPRCHVDCPQRVEQIAFLDEPWRRLANGTAATVAAAADADDGSNGTCDNLPPYSGIGVSSSLSSARWVQFRGAAGWRMHSSPPRDGRCGAEAAGWLNDIHPRAGEKPRRSTACFAFGWSDCLWSAEVRTCACSYDGGSTTIYSYLLPTPPGSPTCVAYCGTSDDDANVTTNSTLSPSERRLAEGMEGHGRAAGAVVASATSAYGEQTAPMETSATSGAHQAVTTTESTGSGGAMRQYSATSPDGFVDRDPSRHSVVGYMPGDARDVGAHLDVVSETRVFGRTPPLGRAQLVQLQVSEDAGAQWYGGETPIYGNQSYLPIKYKFYPLPTFSRVWPLAGPVAGGTNVTVSGHGFAVLPSLGDVRCRFGTLVTHAYFRNDSHVLCNTPSRAQLAVGSDDPSPYMGELAAMQVDGVFRGGDAARLRFALTLNAQDYHSTPGVTDPAANFSFYQSALMHIHPTCGSVRGGVYVTLSGVGFDSIGGLAHDASGLPFEPRCRLSVVGANHTTHPGMAHPLLSLNATSAVFQVPPSTQAGYAYVQVALNGVDFEGEVPYEYLDDPTVVSIVPSGGPLSGGTVVTLMGSGFRALEQEDAYIQQWAQTASSRSQYSDTAGAANRATGPPDASACGDEVLDPNSWMPRVGTDVPDWLQATFARPVRVWRWRVYMSARPRAIIDVELIDMLGRRVRVNVDANASSSGTDEGNVRRTFRVRECPCAGNASRGCSALVEGHLTWQQQPLVRGIRVTTTSDGWESIDALEIFGYAETQQCKLGAQYTSMLLQEPTRVVCPTPAHGHTPLVVNGTSTRGATRGHSGFFYPLYMLPPDEPYHTHTFLEHPRALFYMPNAKTHHAEMGIEPAFTSVLTTYVASTTRAALARLSADEIEGAANATDECKWARDGLCDGPPFCAPYTDCTDCGHCSAGVFAVPVELSLNGRDGHPLESAPLTNAPPAFTFYPMPTIERIWPDLTLATGGTLITIHGEGFASFGDLHTTKCRIGVVELKATYKDGTRVVCEAPPITAANPPAADGEYRGSTAEEGTVSTVGARGKAAVWLTLNDHDYQHVGEVRYFHAQLDEVRPSGGPSGGGTLVTLRGHGFDSIVSPSMGIYPLNRTARCRFRFRVPAGSGTVREGTGAAGYLGGGRDGLASAWPDEWQIDSPVLSRSANELRCVTPRAPTNFTGRVDVLLTLNDLNFLPTATRRAGSLNHTAQATHFTFYAMRLTSLTPRGGPAQGGTTIVIRGEGLNDFGTLEQILCRFGDAGGDGGLIVRASARDNSSIVCTAPNTCDPLDTSQTACDAGQREVPPVQRMQVIIDGQVVPLTPPPANATFWTPREVFVSINGQDFAGGSTGAGSEVGSMTYRYYPLPTLTTVFPTGGPANPPEGSVIYVRGSGFNVLDGALSDETVVRAHADCESDAATDARRVWCRYGTTTTAVSLPAVTHNDTVVTCPLPREHGAGAVIVQISLNGVDWNGDGPESVSEASGDGGDGTGGALDASSEAGGEFTVGRMRGEPTGLPVRYHFFEPPTLTHITPTTGHALGGLVVTLHGARFDVYGTPWQARCRFGDRIATAVAKNASQLVCVLPPSSIPRDVDLHPTLHPTRGMETVAASIDGGFSWTKHDPQAIVRIERYDASAYAVVPNVGPVRGGFALRVHGQGMLALPVRPPPDDAMCVFGSDVRPAAKRSGSWVECIVPPAFPQLPSGAHDLIVRVRVSLRADDYLLEADTARAPKGEAAALSFRYYGEPAVRTLTPIFGPGAGGTRVTVSGDFPSGLNLTTTRCRFGARTVAALAASSAEVVCDTPQFVLVGAAVQERVAVALTFNGGLFWSEATPPLTFRYYVMGLSAVLPLGGPTAGGTLIQVRGAGLELGGNASAVRARVEKHTNGTVERADLGAAVGVSLNGATFRMAPSSTACFAAVFVTINAHGDYAGDYLGGAPSPVTFRFYDPPLVSTLSPAVGPMGGGTMLTMRGAGFDAFGEVPSAPVVHVTSATLPGKPYAGYVVDGILNRDIVLLRGVTYRFHVLAHAHPMIISTISVKHAAPPTLGTPDDCGAPSSSIRPFVVCVRVCVFVCLCVCVCACVRVCVAGHAPPGRRAHRTRWCRSLPRRTGHSPLHPRCTHTRASLLPGYWRRHRGGPRAAWAWAAYPPPPARRGLQPARRRRTPHPARTQHEHP